jgi:hypothetical protein
MFLLFFLFSAVFQQTKKSKTEDSWIQKFCSDQWNISLFRLNAAEVREDSVYDKLN